ncbi:threonine efflux protein [Vibrio sinaloensis DSM 21326]|uniref:Threonine efflux protein n=1 Tax=Vibrio sinaloensis DSM 21326 TaxID=945550 RepID=E8MC72_PHOS4|nr:LysE family transporter [Vibrio sinaloensis]EGA68377.1 threonine efflux protein [Vibrio sinaloensis DSM 21326]
MSEFSVLTSAMWICLFGVMSPGPSFVAITSKSLIARRKQVLWLTLGIALINALWAACALFGLKTLMMQFPWLLNVVQFGGAGYLAWFGIRLLRVKVSTSAASANLQPPTIAHRWSCFKEGVFANLSNPKSLLFYTSVFSVSVPHTTSQTLLFELVAVVFAVSITWYGSLAILLTTSAIQRQFTKVQNLISKACGSLLILFAGLQIL